MAKVRRDGPYCKRDFEIREYPRILLIDDVLLDVQPYLDALRDLRCEVHYARSVNAARSLLRGRVFDLVIVDVRMPRGPYPPEATLGGHRTGIELVRQDIWKYQSATFVVGLTNVDHADVEEFFASQPGHFYFYKPDYPPRRFANKVWGIVTGLGYLPSCFIVHGHDTDAAHALKDYLQHSLGFPEPVILAEERSGGNTLIEKFEYYAADSDLVFALFTPDDMDQKGQPRARQNVVLEYGYFLHALGRKSGRLILLCKGNVEIPSDLRGVVSIDITNGIESAGEEIRRELSGLAGIPRVRHA